VERETIVVRLDPKLIRKIDKQAKKQKISRNKLITLSLELILN